MSQRTVRYIGETEGEVQGQYAADAAKAYAAGWRVHNMAWEPQGPRPTLAITYIRDDAAPEPTTVASQPAPPKTGAKGGKRAAIFAAIVLVVLAVLPGYAALEQARPAAMWQPYTEGPSDWVMYRYSSPESRYYIADPDARMAVLADQWIRGIYADACYYEHGGGVATCNDVEPPVGVTVRDAVALAEHYYGSRMQALLLYSGFALALLVLAIVAFESRRPLPPPGERRGRVPRPGKGWTAAMLIMATFGLISSVLAGLGPGRESGMFQSGNMAGIVNALLNGLIWYLVAYALFLVTAVLVKLVTYARRRVASV